jgi:hypothetical protein
MNADERGWERQKFSHSERKEKQKKKVTIEPNIEP